MQSELIKLAKPILRFKCKELGLLNGGHGALHLGELPTTELEAGLIETGVKMSSGMFSVGFLKMSEIWVTDASGEGLLGAMWRTAEQVAEIASARTGVPLTVYRVVIDTIDKDSLIIPHADAFLNQQFGLRAHVPISTSDESVGTTYHPYNLNAKFWHLRAGGVYAFNNLDPHTVTKLDHGFRSHLLCDLIPTALLPYKDLMQTRSTGKPEYHLANLSINNLAYMNLLNERYGSMARMSTVPEHLTKADVTRSWIQREARSALEQNRVSFL